MAEASIAERVTAFWMQVKIGNPDDCWLWQGYAEKGYGRFYYAGKMMGAHELAVTFTTGEERLPDLDTCHSCHTPLCCNPRHLRFDTRLSNVADMHKAGRARKSTKLTPAEVAQIRQRIAAGARQKDLAAQYGVNNSLISMIKTNKRWAA